MSKFVLKPGGGNLFPNKDKKKPSLPDHNGTLLLDRDYKAGEEIKLSGWDKRSAYGSFISLSVNNYKKEQYPKPVIEDENSVPF